MDRLTQMIMMGSSSTRQDITLLYNTPGTYTWTAPAGVTSVKTLTGRGGSGGGTQQSWSSAIAYFYTSGGLYTFTSTVNPSWTNIGSSLDYSTVISQADSYLSYWSGITTDPAGQVLTIPFNEYYYISSTGNYYINQNSYTYRYRRVGPVTGDSYALYGQSGSVGTSASWTSWATNIEAEVFSSSSGGSSSALGFNFAGSSGTNPTQTVRTNIAVTPGTNYTIIVGNNVSTPTSFIEIVF